MDEKIPQVLEGYYRYLEKHKKTQDKEFFENTDSDICQIHGRELEIDPETGEKECPD